MMTMTESIHLEGKLLKWRKMRNSFEGYEKIVDIINKAPKKNPNLSEMDTYFYLHLTENWVNHMDDEFRAFVISRIESHRSKLKKDMDDLWVNQPHQLLNPEDKTGTGPTLD